ncbi:collectin-12 isoform X2 [Nematostella vectensis]|uniref:collectin-12 isoform X2 n=1 Tax=Nematostella vectensis TaxID=45351 RepID=UPI0020770C86|nr:collectin-12 isoform X2 [Nematostella vectensis]
MYNRTNSIQQVPNRAFSPYAIDGISDEGPPTPSRGVTNPAYENTEADFTHHYEDPGKLAKELARRTGPRQRTNQVYEPSSIKRPLDKADDDEYTINSEWCPGKIILVLILGVSLVALVLVVMIVLGKLGPSCLCENNGDTNSQLVRTGESISLEPLVRDIETLKKNLTQTEAMLVSMVEQNTASLRDELRKLQGNMSDDGLNTLQAALDSLAVRVNVTTNTTNVLFIQLSTTDAAIRGTLSQINSSLSEKVAAIAKMEGPQGPRGFNGSEGPVGPKGLKGDPGLKGDKGDTGANGTAGAPGVKGDKGDTGASGAKGEAGVKGDKGDQGVMGAKGDQGIQGFNGTKGEKGVGDLSACEFKIATISSSPGVSGQSSVTVKEESDKRIFVAGCSSNRADVVQQGPKQTSGAKPGSAEETCAVKGIIRKKHSM